MTSPVFNSPTLGKLSFPEVIGEILDFISKDKKFPYRLVVGTDSRPGKKVDFVTAIVIHRVGKGGRYFWTRSKKVKTYSLRQRIYEEANLSIVVGRRIMRALNPQISKFIGRNKDFQMEIHVDIGTKGQTRDMIKEIVGMIQGNGLTAKIKPDSYGASNIADKHT